MALAVVVGVRLRRRQPQCTVAKRNTEQRGHLFDLLRRRLATHRVIAHRRQPNRTVAHQKTGVDGRAPVESCQPVAERRPLPVEAGAQRFERHTLDPGQHPGEVVLLVGPRGSEREATVSAEHRGDTVLHRRARGGIPEQLGVVVRVQIDEARRERLPLRVNGFRCLFVDVPNRDDAPVLDPNVAATDGRACAVDDLGVADQQVEHPNLLHSRQPRAVG